MNDFMLDCPHCTQSVTATEEMYGQTMECPTCSGTFQIDMPFQKTATRAGNQNTKRTSFNNRAPQSKSEPALGKIHSILTKGEVIVMSATQKLYLPFRPDTVAATNNRVVICRDSIFGTRYNDFLWIDLADATIIEHMFRATVIFKLVSGRLITLEKLTKVDARRIYAQCQEKEQDARYLRRQHSLETARASAGHVVVGQPSNSSASNISSDATFGASVEQDPFERLKGLVKMFNAGLITDNEFQKRKAEILSRT